MRLWNVCGKGEASNADKSVIANLTTNDALTNLSLYCKHEQVSKESLPGAVSQQKK